MIEPRHGWYGVDLAELWRYRELLYFLVWRDVKVRYKQTVLGAGWAIIQPVCTMVIFSVIFGSFAKIPSDGVPYPIFVFAAILPWAFFSEAVSQASLGLVAQANLLKKVYFPRLLLPTASAGLGLVDFVVRFGVYAGIMLWSAHLPGPSVLLLPVLILLTTLLALGVGMFLSGLTVVYRDFRTVVPFLLQAWMHISPVVFPLSLVPEKYRWIMLLNPMTGIIGGFRSVLLNQPLDWTALAASTVLTIAILLFGVSNFHRLERRFATWPENEHTRHPCRRLGKQVKLGLRSATQQTFGEMLMNVLGAPLRRLRTLGESSYGGELFWALRDDSLDVLPGEVVGLIAATEPARARC